MERQTLSAPNTVIIYRRGNVVTLQFDLTYHRLWAWHLSVSCFIIGRLQEKLNLCWISWKLFKDPSLAKTQDGKNARLQEGNIARRQDCKNARLQERKIAKTQDCKNARLQECKIARLQDCKIARTQDCRNARLRPTNVGTLTGLPSLESVAHLSW